MKNFTLTFLTPDITDPCPSAPFFPFFRLSSNHDVLFHLSHNMSDLGWKLKKTDETL